MSELRSWHERCEQKWSRRREQPWWEEQLGLLWNHDRGGGTEEGQRSNQEPDPDLSGCGPIPLKGFEVEH